MSDEPLTFGSLFAGIGGFDLGFERAGMVCRWQVEIDDYCQRVLVKHWPNVRRWDDVRTFPPEPVDDWRVDVVCGGFPCQDISYAGTGAGLAGERSGLFFESIRVVGLLRPRIVVLENVAALLGRGLDTVLGTLAKIGYDAEWHCLPAAYVGAPHIRDRVFVVANTGCALLESRRSPTRDATEQYSRDSLDNAARVPSRCDSGQLAIAKSKGWLSKSRERCCVDGGHWAVEPTLGRSVDGFPHFLDRHCGRGLSYAQSQRAIEGLRELWSRDVAKTVWQEIGGLDRIHTSQVLFAFMREYAQGGRLPREFLESEKALGEQMRKLRQHEIACGTSSRHEQKQQCDGEHSDALCNVPHKIASWDSWECDIPRVAGNVPHRVDRLRALGNAIVPQVAEWIGRRIVERVRP